MFRRTFLSHIEMALQGNPIDDDNKAASLTVYYESGHWNEAKKLEVQVMVDGACSRKSRNADGHGQPLVDT